MLLGTGKNFSIYTNIKDMISKFEGRYRFLSNFYPAKIEHQGIEYPSVEHYYVAMKVNDQQFINGKYYTPGDFREMIASISDPGQVKRIGRMVKLRKDWEIQRLKVMNWGVYQKFKNHEDLRQMLLDTGDQELVEGNWWHDNFFGSCICTKCGNKGENHLGKILMKVRSELRCG
jgi:ribA/ribD-fused uncharacterized protein